MADTNRPVVVRLSDGIEYGVPSAELAGRIYPTADIIRYQDGTAYEGAAAGGEDGGSAPETDAPFNAKMSREELNAYAETVGVDPKEYRLKDDLLVALQERHAAATIDGLANAGTQPDPATPGHLADSTATGVAGPENPADPDGDGAGAEGGDS